MATQQNVVAARSEGAVARPLNVLVPLIRQDFEAADKAGMEYFRAAGTKLNEARNGHFDGRSAADFYEWAEKTFGKKKTQIRTYMALTEVNNGKSFKSIKEFHRSKTASGDKGWASSGGFVRREWTATVDAVAEKARNEQRRIAFEDNMTRQQEREAESKLGLRLIDIGYKVLARELHPDKGGSREAMTRLNRVRDRLKENV